MWIHDEVPIGGSTQPDQWAATQRTVGLTFTQRYPETCHWVEKRRRRLDLATLAWDDIRQLLLIRVSQQYHTFDPAKGPFKNWVNRVITRAICSIWRDHLSSFSRPCITGKGGCPFNVGTDQCSRTPSGRQCAECPAFRAWEKRKKDHHAVRLPLSLENHATEVSSQQGDFLDIEAKKKVIDRRMKKELTRSEWKIYRLLIVKGLPEAEVAKQMGFREKRGKKRKMYAGYSVLLLAKHKFVEKAREIIEEEDLA